MGALLTGLLATKEVNSNLKDELLSSLFKSQVLAVIVTLLLSTIATAIIAYALRGIVGLRVSADIETSGLDVSEHGEEAYIN
jgi:Amt family ammonium transporter